MAKLADIKTNFPQWYQDVVYSSELADQSPTPGCIVIRPYGCALWENIKKNLDEKIQETGAENAYFPLLIPESFFKREQEHVEGFAPELAVVTHAGGKKLEEPLVIRPTSETMIYDMFSRWIKSWRDLPFKINQWANVMRWEKRPRAFIRSREFLWQEGHTAHRTKEEAVEFSKKILFMYRDFIEEYLAIPIIVGEKSKGEKFAGADHTFTVEALMQDGKALQSGTSHVLTQNFSKSFNIAYQDKDNSMQSPHCTSWGMTTRLIGAIIMTHGDEKGLVMPPRIAPIQVVIIPIFRKEEDKEIVMARVEQLEKALKEKNIRVKVDMDDSKSPGAKFFHWELKGVPVRVEIGPKDVENDQIALARRTSKEKKKEFVPFPHSAQVIEHILVDIQADMFKKAKENLHNNWHQVDKLEEFGPKMEKENGLYQTGWCGSEDCAAKLKEYKGTVRCLVDDYTHTKCFGCDKDSGKNILVAKEY